MRDLACLPVFFALAGKKVVLAGGSNAILWKAELCQAAGAEVEVYSEDTCPGLVAFASRHPQVSLVSRRIEPENFHGATLAIAEVENAAEATRLQAAARTAGVAVNIIDKPGFSDFQFGAIVDRSPLVIGISTSGGAPKLAQALRAARSTASARDQALGTNGQGWRERMKALDTPLKTRLRFGSYSVGGRWRRDAPPRWRSCHAARRGGSGYGCWCHWIGCPCRRGPRRPELLTLKALRALQSADVILYDDLVAPAIVEMARREAEKIPVGKRGYKPSCRQDHIVSQLVALASQGKRVVRLKGGDPMILGAPMRKSRPCGAAFRLKLFQASPPRSAPPPCCKYP